MNTPEPLGISSPVVRADEIDGHWSALSRRLKRRRRARRIGAGAAVVAVALALIALGRSRWAPPESAPVATSDAPVELRVASARVHVDPRSRVEVEHDRRDLVVIVVTEGAALFDVDHEEDRRFLVRAPPVEVEVVGTRFRVERRVDGAEVRVAVRVLEGVVQVRRPGEEPFALAAGESWMTETEPRAEAATPSPTGATTEEPARDAPARAAARRVGPRARPSEAEHEAERAAEASDPESLFDQATALRRTGDVSRAASLYQRFYLENPRDPRAGLAAFEVGRLQLEVLRNPGAAAVAFRAVLRLDATAFRREIAMWYLVRIADDAGRVDECRSMRERYLASFPEGVHAQMVRARCGD